ncbi:aldehyde dehydrogenase [Moniliophthora roreri MCA 2997]|uniref:Aldehyde dehydrogenase n=1 Tax=Moniliophthora roreri (strain MCA 2997) TaxID=1381753 RepID=V2X6Y2_MONRO|nr:aldehyde dehydrogenase [Moniliophthora roreri MCA 2997]
MPTTFSYDFNTEVFKGKTSFSTGVFINGQFQDGAEGTTIDVINPTNGQLITKISEATPKDVDIAVEAAQKAFDTTWGLNAPGAVRTKLLTKLASAMEACADELAALEALDNGKTFDWAKTVDVPFSIELIRYYAGWADKIHGQVQETTQDKLTYTRHEPIGVVGQIIPWNYPLMMMCMKIGPALATGNTIILKPSEFTPLSALRMCSIFNEVGFPPGVINILAGYGNTVGAAISSHMKIEKVAFTGSTLTGRKIMESAAKSNLKNVTLELGGKSPNIIFNDCDLEQACNWAFWGIYWNHGQACIAGSRIYVQSGIYDRFLEMFTEKTKTIKLGDPFASDTYQGPQVSQLQFERIMGYIKAGKEQGATVHYGGEENGGDGYFIKPTIFTNTTHDMKIMQEEIFGPVCCVIKFEDKDDVVRQANDTIYGLGAAVFTQDINCAFDVAHKLKAGSVWVNCINNVNPNVPFGGFKQSGIGREFGQESLQNYVNVKAVHVNLGIKM